MQKTAVLSLYQGFVFIITARQVAKTAPKYTWLSNPTPNSVNGLIMADRETANRIFDSVIRSKITFIFIIWNPGENITVLELAFLKSKT